MIPHCETMIVGAGPAGISTWLHLQKYEPQIAAEAVLIDKAVFPRPKLCAGGFGSWGEGVLKNLGIELDIPSLFVSNVAYRFGRDVYHFHRSGCFRMVRRSDFDHALVQTSTRRGLDLHEGERLVDVTRKKERLLVTTDRGQYLVRALVGADGSLSLVRRKTIPPQRPTNLAVTIQVTSPVNPRHDREYRDKIMTIDFSPVREGLQGYVWHFPRPEDHAPSVTHGIGNFRIFRDKRCPDMKSLFRRELISRHTDPRAGPWAGYPIRWFSENDMVSQPNVLLVGDAAGIESAFGGGIHLALYYGEVAANALIDAFETGDFCFHDYSEKLQSHWTGRYIKQCTALSLQIYGGVENPLDAIRRFLERKEETPNLFNLMLSPR